MKKRILALVLAMCLLTSLLPVAVFATEGETTGTCVDGCTYESVTVEATCTEAGYVRYTCTACGDTYDEVTDQALGHKYSEGKCKVCGYEKEAPEAPVVVVNYADYLDSGAYSLDWQYIPNIDTYEIYRSTDGVNFRDWGGTYGRVTRFCPDVAGSPYGETIYWKFRAVDEDGACSEFSNVVSGVRRLGQPQVTASRVESTGLIKISWEPVNKAVQYKVYRSLTGEDGSWSRISTTTKTAVTNSKNMVPGTEYFYKVIALAEISGADSAYSEVKSAVCTLARPVVTTAYDSAKNGVKISWEPVEGAVQYKVYRSLTGEDGSWSRISTTTKTTVTNTKNFDVTQKYYYKVIALAENEAGNSAYSEVKTYMGKLAKPEVSVSNIASSGKIKVSWTKVDGAVKYEVYRATSKTGTYKLLITTKNTSINNTSTTAGKTYYYKVRALAEDPACNSNYSSVKSRTCDLPRPTTTAGLNTKGQPKLTWKAVDGAVSYKVYRSTTLDGSYSLMKTTTSTTYTNTTAAAYETYYYKVVAVASNTAANSAKSEAKGISCTTVNITPSKLNKDFVARVNEYRDYFGIDELEWHKDGELTCRTRAAEYRIDFTGERPDGRSVEKMLEAGKVQIELGLQADATAEEVVDTLMYYDDYEDYAALLMYEGWDYAVVACNNGYWCIMFG